MLIWIYYRNMPLKKTPDAISTSHIKLFVKRFNLVFVKRKV
jgi:hypothetical protein